MPQLARHRLPLEDEGADLDQVLVALHALVVPAKERDRNKFEKKIISNGGKIISTPSVYSSE